MKNTIYLALLSLIATLSACRSQDDPRELQPLNDNWRFMLGASTSASMVDYDDARWKKVNLPHDWAIEGDFSQSHPAGVAGGALPGGIGWYRRHFDLTDQDRAGRIRLVVDGSYMNTAVYVNGTLVGQRPYGYVSQEYDLTHITHTGRNVVALRIDNSVQPNSRWYSGCGIFRNVWLLKSANVYIPRSGTCIRTPLVNDIKADISVETTVCNQQEYDIDLLIETKIVGPKGITVASDKRIIRIDAEATQPITQDIRITDPQLWDVNNPQLYEARTKLFVDGKEVDRYSTPFGIRTFYFDSERGFILNNKHTKINGVCLHQDYGCLGAVSNLRAIEKRLRMLKDMGCNAIRTSHNPPAPEFLDLCDRLGFLVMDEAFDMWSRGKNVDDYSRFFDKWHERDIKDFVLRDRNHPSVIMWSIGNEVLEQWTTPREDSLLQAGAITEPNGVRLTKELCSLVHKLDPTRPVTAACQEPKTSNNLFKAGALDIISFNNHNDHIKDVPKNFPGKPFLLSESVSALMTRGYYKMPSTVTFIYPDRGEATHNDLSLSCSSYDNCHTPWGTSHEKSLLDVRENDFVSGQFVWTGYDYLGEPTPYDWPARSSYFGIIDLAGFPKDVYYLYQSEWQTEKTVLHLFPHWNWKAGDEIDMWCYYNNADEVELFVNGKSHGVQHKTNKTLHALWRVLYEEGSVRVVSRKDGKIVAEKVINTAGRPHAIRLTQDRKKIHADGSDLCYVTAEIVDRDGNLCPNAENEVSFNIEGTAVIAGVDNGCQFDNASFKANSRKAFYGKCMVVLRSSGTPGNVRLKASAEGLNGAELTVNCLTDDTY